jgi:flagellar protein FliJ
LRRRYGQAAMVGALDVDQLLDSHRYEMVLAAQLKFIADQHAKLAVEIEKRRQALVAADREVRVLEKLRENLRERHRQEEQHVEMKQIDEVAGRMFSETATAERSL